MPRPGFGRFAPVAATDGARVSFVPSDRERASVTDLARAGDDGFARLAAADAVRGLAGTGIAGPMARIRGDLASPHQAG